MPKDIWTIANTALRAGLDLALPIHCLGCGREGAALCDDCVAQLPRLDSPYCRVCAAPGISGLCRNCRRENPLGGIAGVRAPYLMDGLARAAVHHFKCHNCKVAAPVLAAALANYLETNPLPGDTLTPVPMHRKKLRQRGYNQAALLARGLGKITGLPVNDNLLVRRRNSPPQALARNVQERRENIADAFAGVGDVLGKNIILVDDVCTTGSTLGACAAVLLEAGAASVRGLTLTRERLQFGVEYDLIPSETLPVP